MKKKKFLLGILLTAILTGGCSAQTSEQILDSQVTETEITSETDVQIRQQESEQQTVADKEDTSEATAKDEASADVSGDLTVTFMDVGQGNAILVENDGEYMLIDGGDRNKSSYVVSYLQKQGIGELTYVISSHYDADHLNGIVGALNVFPCDLLLDADYTTDTKVYQSLQSVITEKDIAEVHPDMGDTYTLGDASFTIVCPDAYDYDNDNDNSIGIRLVYGDTSFLICGDASSTVEKVMMMSGLELQSDVYLASHHGSSYSSSLDFLKKVQPQAVVISAGAGNSYGHPTTEVLSNIQTVGANLYRTDLQGNIIVTSDGSSLTWNVDAATDYRSGDEVSGTAKNSSTSNSSQGGTGATSNSSNNTTQEAAPVADNTTQNVTQDVTQNTTDSTPTQDTTEHSYVLNTNTKKFHNPGCYSIDKMKEENKASYTGTRQELIDQGYSPCGNCNP